MRNRFRSLIAVGASCVLGLTLSACGGTDSASSGAPSGSGTLTIGLAVANLQADFFNQVRQSVESAAQEKGVKVIVADAGGDADRQVSQIQDLITQQVDALIYIPAGATAAAVPVRNAQSAGIPVVTLDRNPEGAPGDTFIATDSEAAAKELGEWVVKESGGTGNLGVVQGQIGTTPEIARDNGFKAGIAGSSIVEVERQASDAWHQDEGFDIAQDMLQAHPEITIIFGRADALALGAAQAARAAGRSDILIVGFDGDEAGLKGVKDGTIAATMVQKTRYMGRLAVESAIDLVNGKELPAEQLQEGTLATPDNVDQFIAEHP